MKDIQELLGKLEKVKKYGGRYQARCPAHDDKTPSLTIKQEQDKILIHCQAGCSPEAVLEKIGLQLADLFIEPIVTASRIVAEYDYQDEQRKLLFQVVRYDPKAFRQRHRNGSGEWAWNLEGVRRVIYHLPDILQVTDQTIFWVEGERDCDALWNHGQVATTSPGGASGFNSEYAKPLAGKRVTIIPDNDGPGMSYARQVITSLREVKADTHAIILDKKDVSDWLAAGGDAELLPTLEQDISVLWNADKPKYKTVAEAVVWEKSNNMRFGAEAVREERTGVHARISISHEAETLGWSLFNVERSEDRTRLANSSHAQLKGDFSKVYAKEDLKHDLDAFCLGLWDYQLSISIPELLSGDSTPTPVSYILEPYIIEGGGTILFAPPGRGKSFTALLWAISIQNGIQKLWRVKRTPTLFINLERSRKSVTRRLAMVNQILELPATQPLYTLNARGKSLTDVIASCRKAVRQYGIGFVVLDSISRTGFGDLNDNRPMNAIIDSLSSLCDTWLALGHTPRGSEEHLFGSVMADAGADIVVQLSSEIATDKTLGITYEITKSNDIAKSKSGIITLEFTDNWLTAVRQGNAGEFPSLATRKGNLLDDVMEFILNQDTADATATEVANGTGLRRDSISRLFIRSGRFVITRRERQQVYYGVKDLSG